MPKSVHAGKKQEWKGLDRLSRTIHEMNCIYREISKDDYGIDGEIEILVPKVGDIGFETTGKIVKFQAKSGESYIKGDTPDSFFVPIKKDDLEYWNSSNFPVLFIVYHPKDDVLYWKDTKNYIASTPNIFQAPIRIIFDKRTDLLSSTAYESVSCVAQSSPPRVSFHDKERLYSNLLLVKRRPILITKAPTRYKTDREVRNELEGFVPPFCIVGDHLYTLSNLRDRNCSLRHYCNTESISDFPAERWLENDAGRGNYVYLLNQLLGKHLWRCGLTYSPKYKRNYFPIPDSDELERKVWWTNPRTGASQPRSVAKFYTYGYDKFWRHLAVNLELKQFGDAWFLQIFPKYFFTIDGSRPWDSDKVGKYTTSQKANEHNKNVLNHVLFWAEYFSQGESDIKLDLDYRVMMVIEKTPLSGIADFAIPYDPATYEEPEDSGQLDFFGTLIVEDESDDDDEY